MNLSFTEAKSLVSDIIKNSSSDSNVIKVFFPSFVNIHAVNSLVDHKSFFTGAQNCSEFEKGAYTGEVSASMIKAIDCKYVLIGHSERRIYFKESNDQLTLKIEQALKNDLIPVFCFGELLADRKAGKHFETVSHQLAEVLRNFSGDQVKNMVLAYEPVWAIGTGETASPAQAQEMHAFVRECINDLFDHNVAADVSVLYGGSCNAQNAKELFACPDVDGGLIGGAALNADDFARIYASAQPK